MVALQVELSGLRTIGQTLLSAVEGADSALMSIVGAQDAETQARLAQEARSRLPDPAWPEQWLDRQNRFDSVWEGKVVERILHNLSLLMERSFASVQELNRYRKEVAQSLAAAAVSGGAAAAPQPA